MLLSQCQCQKWPAFILASKADQYITKLRLFLYAFLVLTKSSELNAYSARQWAILVHILWHWTRNISIESFLWPLTCRSSNNLMAATLPVAPTKILQVSCCMGSSLWPSSEHASSAMFGLDIQVTKATLYEKLHWHMVLETSSSHTAGHRHTGDVQVNQKYAKGQHLLTFQN